MIFEVNERDANWQQFAQRTDNRRRIDYARLRPTVNRAENGQVLVHKAEMIVQDPDDCLCSPD
jgi:hypothetical protein